MVSTPSRLESKQPYSPINQGNLHRETVQQPRLTCKVTVYSDRIILSQKGWSYSFPNQGQSGENLQQLLLSLDGTFSIQELQQHFSPEHPERIDDLLQNLSEQGLIEDIAQIKTGSKIDNRLEFQDFIHQLFAQSLEESQVSQPFQSSTNPFPVNVLVGWAIEQNHLLSRNGDVYAPLLGFPSSSTIRELIKTCYNQTSKQQELLLEALIVLGITPKDLNEIMPLPETTALYHALIYWANFDPIFFLSLLEIWEDQTFKRFESYLKACQQASLHPHFLGWLKQIIRLNQTYKLHKSSPSIFQEIPPLEATTIERFRRQSYLFVELYCNFYKAIGNYYSSDSYLIRRISTI